MKCLPAVDASDYVSMPSSQVALDHTGTFRYRHRAPLRGFESLWLNLAKRAVMETTIVTRSIQYDCRHCIGHVTRSHRQGLAYATWELRNRKKYNHAPIDMCYSI